MERTRRDEPADLTAEVDLGAAARGGAPPDLHDPGQRSQVESALRSVAGVLAARIVPGFERTVDEVHVLAAQDRSPKQAVRDLQSLLMARFGITTDHRVFSVVQIDEATADTAPRPRIVISQVAVSQQGLEAQARVSVTDGERDLDGQAEGPASAAGRRRATARAALAALRPLLGERRVVEVEGVEVAEVLGHEVALCLVHFHSSGGENTVVGSAIVRRDESDAIARAVLDALNRAIEDRI